MKRGSKASPETRAKMRASQLKRWHDRYDQYLQTCVLEPHVGAKRSKATREQMSISQICHCAANPEAVQARAQRLKTRWSQPGYAFKMAARRNWMLVDPSGKLYLGVGSAAKALRRSPGYVSRRVQDGKPVAEVLLERVITNPDAPDVGVRK